VAVVANEIERRHAVIWPPEPLGDRELLAVRGPCSQV
jgi:hypothetical protein